MMAFVRTSARDSWKLAAIGILFLVVLIQGFPVILEQFYPILDTKGGNLAGMEVDKKVYHPGDIVFARFKFQKQRNVTGEIKWELVRITPDPIKITMYAPRKAAAPVSIIDHFASIEPISQDEIPGRYRFRGTITYPGGIIYNLSTECFQVAK